MNARLSPLAILLLTGLLVCLLYTSDAADDQEVV